MHKFIEWQDAEVVARKYEKAFCIVRINHQIHTVYIKTAKYTPDPDGVLEMCGLSITSLATELFYGHPEYCHIANGWHND